MLTGDSRMTSTEEVERKSGSRYSLETHKLYPGTYRTGPSFSLITLCSSGSFLYSFRLCGKDRGRSLRGRIRSVLTRFHRIFLGKKILFRVSE